MSLSKSNRLAVATAAMQALVTAGHTDAVQVAAKAHDLAQAMSDEADARDSKDADKEPVPE